MKTIAAILSVLLLSGSFALAQNFGGRMSTSPGLGVRSPSNGTAVGHSPGTNPSNPQDRSVGSNREDRSGSSNPQDMNPQP
jgi:hypothetical protein